MKPSFVSVPPLFNFQFLFHVWSISLEQSCYRSGSSCVWDEIALGPVRDFSRKVVPASRGSSSAVPMEGKGGGGCNILPNSGLLFRNIFFSKTKGRDPHIHTPCSSKETTAPLFTRTSAFGSAEVSLDHH